jgi:hypothetical protein
MQRRYGFLLVALEKIKYTKKFMKLASIKEKPRFPSKNFYEHFHFDHETFLGEMGLILAVGFNKTQLSLVCYDESSWTLITDFRSDMLNISNTTFYRVFKETKVS